MRDPAPDMLPPTGSLEDLGRTLDAVPPIQGLGLWAYDRDGGRMHWSAGMRGLLGVATETDASLEAWLEVVHEDDRRRLGERVAAGLPDGDEPFRILHDGGGVHHAVVRGGPVPGVDLIAGVVEDLTERAVGDERAIEILDAISDGYFMVDHEWRFTVVNRQAERVARRDARDLVGRVLWHEFAPAAGTRIEAAYREAMERRVPVTFEEYYAPLDTWLEIRAHPAGTGLAVYFRDITARRRRDEERDRLLAAERRARRAAESARAAVAHRASHDPLTGLLNRNEAVRLLDGRLNDGQATTVLFIDLDRFKLVNDSIGHHAGDALLRVTAERILSHAGSDSVTARVGGDEFLVGIPTDDRVTVAGQIESMLAAFRRPLILEGISMVCTASIGVATGCRGVAAPVVRDADVALQRAKGSGRDRAVWFDDALRREVVDRVGLEHELRRAMEHGAVGVAYQPMFDLSSGRAIGVETLARWDVEGRGPVSPMRFIPIAEETGLIVPLGEMVLHRALADGAAWSSTHEGWTTWVNVAPRQLSQPGYAAAIARHLEASGIHPGRLGLEVTESMLIEADEAVAELTELSRLGVRVAIDDFGTGHSSIARLRALPVDSLKIDRAFIRDAMTDAGIATIRAVVDLGHALGMTVIAEGVETAQELAALSATGCDVVSGYLLGRPVPAHEVPATIAHGSRLLAPIP